MTWLDGDPADLTISQASAALRSGRLTAAELVEATLTRAQRTEPELHAYVKLTGDAARATAEQQDDDARGGSFHGPLHGIPLGIKDIFDVAGLPTKCNSKSRSRVKAAQEDSASVAMLRQAGGIVIGKTVTQEFAAGVVSPPARNPWDPSRIPGGSSGGSAAAVAAGSAMAAMGSDTGGSIRIPASVCGTAGLKPTFGVLSTKGVFPLSWSLDTVGPLAKSAEDAWLMYGALLGIDELSLSPIELGEVRVGVSHPHFFERLEPGVYRAIREAIAMLAAAGAAVVDAPWNDARAARAAGFIINRVETEVIHREGVQRNPGQYGPTLVERVKASSVIPASGYVRALQARTVVRGSIEQVFLDHGLDVMITPASPATALLANDLFARYDDGQGPESVTLAYTRMTMPFNATGQPILVIPCGLDERGLPVGLQIAARPYDEERLCRIGMAFETVFANHFGAGWNRPPMNAEVAL